jgi:hypothetical protein
MAFIIGNGTIEGGSSAFRIKNSSATVVFEQGVAASGGQNFGYYANTGVPCFIAGRASDPGWITFATNAWAKTNNYCTEVAYNRGSHYSTTNTRFTCPISGAYLFIWSTYMYATSYIHPQFAVNGNVSLRRVNVPYRIRGYGQASNYQQDGMIEEVINCVAGDFVEVYMYAGGTGVHYPRHSYFAGAYVG